MDNAWNVLKEYDFFSNNTINADFVCILCKKILIDPRVVPCGCRYCKICIENYLENGNNICPGTTDECKEENLDLIKNINIDHCLIKKISKLILNCPIESCKFSDQLINMRQHLIVCRENAYKCPLSANGCNFISLSKKNVYKHNETSKDKHLELVLSENDNIKNNNNLLNKNLIKLKQEIEILKNNNTKLKTENDNKLKQNMETINNLHSENNIKTTEMWKYKQKYENELNAKNNLSKCLSNYLSENRTEFIWKIDNLSEIKKDRKTVYSDEFYIFQKEIKMQLTFEYYSSSTYKVNAKGSFTNKSLHNYPFVCDFTVGIINDKSQNFYKSFKGNKPFDSIGVSFDYSIDNSDISKYGFDQLNYLILKLVINLSIDWNEQSLLNNTCSYYIRLPY